MEHARRLYLIDEFDRQYKQLQRPAASVAKARSVVQLNDTLRNRNFDEHEKARQYVAELHRYLNVNAPLQQQATQRKGRQAAAPRFNTLALSRPPAPAPASAQIHALAPAAVATRRQAAAAAAATAEDEQGEVFRPRR